MDLEEGSSRTGRGTKSLDSLYRYGLIVIRIDIQIQNFLQMSYDWCRRSRKNINISMVFFWSISHAAGLSDCRNIAHWRSGNASDFDSAIRGFESHMRRSASDFAFPLMQVGFSFSLCHLSQRWWLKELSNVPGGFALVGKINFFYGLPLLQLAVKNCNSSKKTDIAATLYLFATQET